MKKAAKYFILALLIFATVFSIAACEDLGDLNGILGGLNNTDNKTEEWTMETVYSQAKALGYEGTMDELLALITGVDGTDGTDGKDGIDGVSITGSEVRTDGHLIFILSNGSTVDAGKLPSSTAGEPGVYKVTFDLGNGETFEQYSSNYSVSVPEKPEKEGFTFCGWEYFEPAFNRRDAWKFDSYAVTRDMTLYAKWTDTVIREDELLLVSNYKALFNVVYTQSSGAAGKRAADSFVKTLRNLGVEIGDAISDRNAVAVTDCEIIIGADALNRGNDCSVSSSQLGGGGRVIKTVGDRVIIATGDPAGIADLLGEYMNEQMKITNYTQFVKEIKVERTYSYESIIDYKIKSIKIGSNNISSYTLVYAISDIEDANFPTDKIRNFADTVFEYSGIVINEGYSSSANKSIIIRYVDTYVGNSRDKSHELEQSGGFRAYIDGSNYIIECCYMNVFNDAFEEFVKSTITSKSGNVVISEEYTDDADTVYYEDFGAKGNGITDDYKAMYDAHIFANQCGQTVCGKAGAHYYVGSASLTKTIPVMTDVNFNGATITVNDLGSDAYKNRFVKLFTTTRQYAPVSLTGDEVYALYAEYHAANPTSPEKLIIDGNTESFPWLVSKLETESMVRILSANHKDFVRHGANQNSGASRMDVFMVEANGHFVRETDTDLDGNGVIGNVTTPVAYSFGSTDVNDPSVTRAALDSGRFNSDITQLIIYRNDDAPITIENGTFYNICCHAVAETEFKVKYHAYYRGFELYRPNVTIQNIKHRMKNEPEMHIVQDSKNHLECDMYCDNYGSRQESYPYYGFFFIQYTSNLLIKDCSLTGHTTYYEDKPATGSTGGKVPAPVAAGSYDFVVERSCNVNFYNVTQGFSEDPDNPGEELDTGLADMRYWGIMSSNGSKNMRFENCAINRFDAHQGFWNATLINTTLGHSFNVIGGGTLNAIGVTKITGSSFISLRADYGGTFRGDMNLIDCNFHNYHQYNTNRGSYFDATPYATGTIINSGFSTTNSGFRTPEALEAVYNSQFEATYAEQMNTYADKIANGTMTQAEAEAKAYAAAEVAAEKMAKQGAYWLWDFGYDCYMPITVTIKNFKSVDTQNLYLFPAFKDAVFTYNYDPENETVNSITNVLNITQQINIVEESADAMPTKIKICSGSATNDEYSKLYSIPINYGYNYVNPFE